jgi:hypothetical protein
MRVSVVILALWAIFIGAVWATWITVSAHNLGILSVVIGVVILLIELFVPSWWSVDWRKRG